MGGLQLLLLVNNDIIKSELIKQIYSSEEMCVWLLPGSGWLLASFHSSLTGWAPLYTLHLKLADSPTRTAALWGSMAMIGL